MHDATTARQTTPVQDWATDYDLFDPAFLNDPFAVYDELRRQAPVARTERWGGQWMPVRYADVVAVASDPARFSSISTAPIGPDEPNQIRLPPINADPPDHGPLRRALLPSFSPKAIERLEGWTTEIARSLVAEIQSSGDALVDAADRYARHLPVRVIATMLGIPTNDEDRFVDWTVRLLQNAGQDRDDARDATRDLLAYFKSHVLARRETPGEHEDLITELLAAEIDGEPLTNRQIQATCMLLLLAGIDTTWSSIGAALAHLGANPDDRRRLVAEPDLLPVAIEELLRVYSPVTLARIATQEAHVGDRTVGVGDRVLVTFPAANRDPEVFDDPDVVHLDRVQNRHVAFGVGIHRCLGSNLARMELRVALREWLAAFPEFSVVEGEPLEWTGGAVRGPRRVPVRLG